MRNPALTRRLLVQAAGLAGAALMLGGCSSETAAPATEPVNEAPEVEPAPDAVSDAEPQIQEPTTAEPEPATDPAPADTKTLVAYFSVSGNTAAVAEAVAAKTSADLFAITPVEAYTAADTEYNSDTSRTSTERPERDTIVIELVENAPANWDEYNLVYFGFPIWWGAQAWAVNEFLRNNDFAGKTIVPFCTSGSSPMVSSASLEAIAGSGTWKEGTRISSASATSEIDALITEA